MFSSSNNSSVFGQQQSFGIGSNLLGSTPFGASSQPSFSATSAPTFGSTSSPAFNSTTSPFSSRSSSVFGQSTSAFGSNLIGTAMSPQFGGQVTTPVFGSCGFGQTCFGGQHGGSRVTPYAHTLEVDSGRLTKSISALTAYKDKSHEELRWEDYQQGDKGGPNGMEFNTTNNTQSNSFTFSPAFTQLTANSFSSTTPFDQSCTPTFGATSTPAFGTATSAFGTPAFGQSTSAFGTATSPFGAQSSPFGGQRGGSRVTPYGQTPEADNGGGTHPAVKLESISAMPAYKDKSFEELRWEDYQQGDKGVPNPALTFGTSTSTFSTTKPQGAIPSFTSGVTSGNTQSSPLSQSTTPSLGQTTFPFGQTAPSLLTSRRVRFYHKTPYHTMPFKQTQNSSGCFEAPAGGIGGTSSVFGQNNFGRMSASQTPSTGCLGTSTSNFGTNQGQGATSSFASGLNFNNMQSFRGQNGGSRVTPYAQTPEAGTGSGTQPAGKLVSMSAMNAYKDKSHEELRWEDYQQNTPAFSQTTLSMPFQSVQPTQYSGTFGFRTPAGGPNPVFRPTPVFGSSTSPSLFGTPNTSTFSTTQAQGAIPSFTSGVTFGNTQSSTSFQSTTPSLGQTSSPFGQTVPLIGQITPAFGQSNAFGGNLSFQQNSGGFGFGAPAGGIGGTLSVSGQNNLVFFFACLSI